MNKAEETKNGGLDSVVEKLTQAKYELDELVSQLSLGKVEAKDKLEEIKKDFLVMLRDLKGIIQADAQKATVALVTKIIELETALLSGQADVKKVFEVQKKEIVSIIVAVEDEIAKRFGNAPLVTNFIHEAEKFKLKLEIMRLRFTVKKFKVKDAFHTGMHQAIETVRTVRSGIRKANDRYRNFRDEIRLAYSHMKKAVKKL